MGIDGSEIKKRNDELRARQERASEKRAMESMAPLSVDDEQTNSDQETQKEKAQKPHVKMRNQSGQFFEVDCSACKLAGGMEATRVSRFSSFIRFIGTVIVVPSVLGMAFAVLMFFSGGSAAHEVVSNAHSSAERAGASIGAAIGMGLALFIFCTSLVGGLIGWLLLMKKNVFKCVRCGYILDRS